MPAKARKKARPKSPAQPRRARVLALISIDEGPIRRAALADYRALEREVGSLRRQLEHFETVDCPAYARWEARTFGPQLNELRNATMALHKKQDLLAAVEEEMLWADCSAVVAYRRIMQAREGPAQEPEEGKDFAGSGDDAEDEEAAAFFENGGSGMFNGSDLPPGVTAEYFDGMSRNEQREFRIFYENVAELFAQMSGQAPPSLEEALARDRARQGGVAPLEVPPATPGADRIKELYRKVVRQLHPDAQGEFAPRERELWHELQEAYRARDLERLEAVAARVALGGGAEGAESSPVGVLLRIIHETRAAVSSLRRGIARARKEPAWRFSEPAASRPAETRRRTQLTRALKETQYHLARVTAILGELALKAAKPPRKTRPPQRARRSRTCAGDQAEFF